MDMLSTLMSYGLEKGLFEEHEIPSVQERLIDRFKKPFVFRRTESVPDIDSIMEPLLSDMASRRLITPDTISQRDIIEAYLIDAIMPSPLTVKGTFGRLFEHDSEKATGYLHHISVASNYIKTRRLSKNIAWTAPSPYGMLELTINLAKPEKDPRDIANQRNTTQHASGQGIPKCVLCKENEQNMHNARMNLRIVPVTLGNEKWHLQYSPYQYYGEHAIVLSDQHRPMAITGQTPDYLFDFVTAFPHYFLGSNADLPIVGGSILNHDHFQGGRHTFPLDRATDVPLIETNGVHVSIPDWPMSVIRLRSTDRNAIKEMFIRILSAWKSYDNETLDILSETDGTSHHTVTPIARFAHGVYRLDIVLRDNHTTAQYPEGVYHPHPGLWHIKKENIGLIEVMGLAILPGRLTSALEAVRQALDDGLGSLPGQFAVHEDWFGILKSQNRTFTENDLLLEVGKVFTRVLEDAGVFKRDRQGQRAFHDFVLSALGVGV
jgi:UDPglucose--hexose-1-phosphate uridylyltransferase